VLDARQTTTGPGIARQEWDRLDKADKLTTNYANRLFLRAAERPSRLPLLRTTKHDPRELPKGVPHAENAGRSGGDFCGINACRGIVLFAGHEVRRYIERSIGS
jgi:hypothetical protein